MATPEEMAATMEANLAEKTGKSMEAWLSVLSSWPEKKHGEIVKRLKSEHGVTHGFANLIAHKALKSSAADADEGDLVAAQYAGKKAGLKPVYDQLVAMVEGFGSDVELAPKKAYVSVRRKKQFAIFQPSTASRLDVGINLKGVEPSGRLEASGSFNAMVSHRVRLEAPCDVDGALKDWLKAAYDAAG
ncbi:DUF5655 domain-containing protein [Hyphobacterium marinum]|uniref:DUF5655 domain-containing protein n=1 Tax=Hyphobacterium marinum TaxID=3116574 RepID=A0ABU7LUU8_9PROT|nr:DUF5655 domain-containing protein [Hyphobacterium sp. Y6023]MEE2565328.1 DUF5655 domain-containing protein [Hyphobacterium sp. Y6023]